MLVTNQDQQREDIERWLGENHSRTVLIPLLQKIQSKYNYISEFAMQLVADLLQISSAEVYGVVTFYSFLYNKPRGKSTIRLCRTISCDLKGKDEVARQLENSLGIKFGETTSDGEFSLEYTNCIGLCDRGPAMMIDDKIYTGVKPENVHVILDEFKQKKRLNNQSLLIETHSNNLLFSEIELGKALNTIITKSPKSIIEEIKTSGLRGRGGAGFPAGLKLELCAAENPKGEHIVVCNADEGEPGTFKDRMLLTDYAELVFEGLAIAAHAVNARKAYIYLREEYHYLQNHLQQTLNEMTDLLQKLQVSVEIRMGAGAYICGEETALIDSMEGQRGEPRDRPPFPVTDGYLHKPTAVLNVETLAWIPAIILKGADWFSSFGTENSTGLKLFSVSGHCGKPGVYQFPLGITLNKLLKEADAKNVKAVQVGGASGISISKDQFDRKLCFEDIPPSGSVIVFGEDYDMLDIIENFMEFFVDESCGQCTPCREGNQKLLEGVRLLKQGKCSSEHLEELIKLGKSMQISSKCGLGQTSANGFISICQQFRHEIMNRKPQEQGSQL